MRRLIALAVFFNAAGCERRLPQEAAGPQLTPVEVAQKCSAGSDKPQEVYRCVTREFDGLASGEAASMIFDTRRVVADLSQRHAEAFDLGEMQQREIERRQAIESGRGRCGPTWDGVQRPGVGMTERQAYECGWGQPKFIDRETDVSGTTERWSYPGIGYITLKNGRVQSVHERL